MALANVATLLARRAKGEYDVLMVDWDLEAPGLTKYFPKQAGGKALNDPARPGLIDLFTEIRDRTGEFAESDPVAHEQRVRNLVAELNVDAYVTATDVPHLHLMKAGRLDGTYGMIVNSFRWDEFYERAPWAIPALAERLTRRYRYVLVDSRTGVTDTSGICTMLLPEKLVVVFTPNAQSLEGVSDLVHRAIDHRRSSDDLRPLIVYPLPSRIETTEPGEQGAWRLGNDQRQLQGWQRLFEKTIKEVYGLQQCNLGPYFDDVQIQHQPYYAYGEKIAVQIERSTEIVSLPKSYERFVDWLTNRSSAWEDPAEAAAAAAERERRELDRKAERAYAALKDDTDRQVARRIFTRLVKILGDREVGEYSLRIVSRDECATDVERAHAVLEHFTRVGLLHVRKPADDPRAPDMVQIADERLATAWRRLDSWIRKDTPFLVWRQTLDQAVDAWKAHDEDGGQLLRGRALHEALAHLESRPDDVNADERRYIEASRNHADKVARLQRTLSPEGGSAVGPQGIAAPPPAFGAPKALPASVRTMPAWLAAGAVAAVLVVGAYVVVQLSSHDTSHAESVAAAAAVMAGEGDPVDAALLLATLHDDDADAALAAARTVAEAVLPAAILEPPQHGITGAALSPNGSHLLTTARDGSAVIATIEPAVPRLVYRGAGAILGGAFRTDGKAIVLLEEKGSLIVVTDTTAGWGEGSSAAANITGRVPAVEGTVAVTFIASGALVSVDQRGSLRTWRTSGGSEWRSSTSRFQLGPVRSGVFSADGSRLATVSSAGRVTIWDVALLSRQDFPDSAVGGWALSADGSHLATVTGDGLIRVRDQLGRAVWEDRLPGLTGIALSPFGSRLALSAASTPTRVVQVGARQPTSEAMKLGGSGTVTAVAFGADSSIVVTAADSNVRVWKLDAALPSRDASWEDLRAYFAARVRSCLPARTRVVVLKQSEEEATQDSAECRRRQAASSIAMVELSAPESTVTVPAPSPRASKSVVSSAVLQPRTSRPRADSGYVPATGRAIDSTGLEVLERLKRGQIWAGDWTRSDGSSASLRLELRAEGRGVAGVMTWVERPTKGDTAALRSGTGEGKLSGTFDAARLEFQLQGGSAVPTGPADFRLLVADSALTLRGTVVGADKIAGTFRGGPISAASRR
jgi:WD40 repeat protein/MinD-like ATPase involved in chromosome partitioning or flagellar assembly